MTKKRGSPSFFCSRIEGQMPVMKVKCRFEVINLCCVSIEKRLATNHFIQRARKRFDSRNVKEKPVTKEDFP